MYVSDESIIMASIVANTATDAAAMLNMSFKTYKKKALQLGCYHTNEGFRKKKEFADSFDDMYFDVIDSVDKAYFLGYMAADGCVDKNRLSFCISKQDESVLYDLCDALSASHDCVKDLTTWYVDDKNVKHSFEGVYLSLRSWHMTDKLRGYNIVERKSYRNVNLFSKIPREVATAWVVGFLDGDGCIYWNKKAGTCRISFYGNEATLLDIHRFLTDCYCLESGQLVFQHNLLWSLDYHLRNDVVKLLIMYCFSTNLHLARKWDIAHLILFSYAQYGNFRNQFVFFNKRRSYGLDDKMLSSDKYMVSPGYVKNVCIDCGKVISGTATRCKSCESLYRSASNGSKRPGKDILISILKEVKNFKKIGEFYGVSDNAVRKWCKYYGLPFRTTDLRQMTDEDWSKYEVN